MDPKDRRKHPRFEGKFNVDLLNMGDDPSVATFEAVVEATALDVSRQGMRLQCQYQVPVGSLLSAIVYYKGQGSVCLCKVVWKREEMGELLYGLYIEDWPQLDLALEKELKAIEKREAEAAVANSIPSAPAVVTNVIPA